MNVIDKPSARVEDAVQVPLQPASLDIWQQKYQLRDRLGEPVDADIDACYRRIAGALAEPEANPELRRHWRERFLWALHNGAIPAGRIVSNAGAQAHKPATSTINCTVSDSIDDSMDSILRKLHEAGITLKSWKATAPITWRISGVGTARFSTGMLWTAARNSVTAIRFACSISASRR